MYHCAQAKLLFRNAQINTGFVQIKVRQTGTVSKRLGEGTTFTSLRNCTWPPVFAHSLRRRQ